MLSLPVGIVLAVAALFGAFLFWYGGRGRPLTSDEIETRLRQLAERNQDPHGQALLQDVRDLVSQDDGREFVMQNLVRYRPKALYPPGHDFGDDPRAADRRYGRAILWPLLRRACVLVFVARRSGRFIDPPGAEPWHYVAMVRYRSRRDFLDFALEIERGDIVMHKWAAIATTHVFPVQPLLSLMLVRSTVLALLSLAGLLAWALLR
jgi:hypothetical protein